MLPSFTPEVIVNAETLRGGLDISPDGTKVVYCSAIWVADINKEGSARQLTSGSFNDTAVVFGLDSQTIYFLSDRHKAGGPNQIYTLPLNVGGEAIPITSTSLKKGVSSFQISPDGQYIAFASPDEPTEEQELKDKRKDDAVVWGDRVKGHDGLRLLRLAARTVSTFALPNNIHVKSFAWHHDSKQVVISTAQYKRIEAEAFPSHYVVVSVENPNRKRTGHGSNLVWLANDSLLETRYHDPNSPISCLSLQHVSPKDQNQRIIYAGQEDDAVRVVDLRSDNLVAVEIESGLDSRIDIVDTSGKLHACVYHTKDDAIHGWSVRRLEDGNYIVAAIRSSGPRKEVSNIWAGTTDGTQTAELKRLSNHLQKLQDTKNDVKIEAFYWTARDGTNLNGLISKPAGAQGKLPTLLRVHGGARDTPAYLFHYSGWGLYLAAAGFCCIQPNYRGSSGRGAAFAETQQSGVGTLDWTDCEDMLQAALDRGIADRDRLGICGWSQGGFMTAWGVSQTKNLFKAGCMGAGVSDWGALAAESDVPEFEAGLGGNPPWDITTNKRNDPVNHVKDVETAVLIIHGEKDERVPVGQAVGYYRGLRRMSKYPDRHELVVYPREPHGFTERTHAEDVLKRVLDHFVTWLL
ncbi:alpha/beta-hydrolase [Auriculariales sp. MPI-PUGE-AT-0066]|nr:alpha/beta-hydrolase [Auriculariales sp. MPI-PUGE-AT-0066]